MRYFLFFFFNDTATTEIYTLSLHDALPISGGLRVLLRTVDCPVYISAKTHDAYVSERFNVSNDEPRKRAQDRKSTRLNSSHLVISYAVFCLKKKKTLISNTRYTNCDA